MQGRWRATGCGIPRYPRHSALGCLSVHGVHAYIETVAQIAKVLLQRRLSGFTGFKAIRFSRRLAHCPPAFEAVAMVRHDLKHIDYRHTTPSALLHACGSIESPPRRSCAATRLAPCTINKIRSG